jgi:hypothetical protein
MAAFIGMNPSWANAVRDDRTVATDIAFVKSWGGFGGLLKLNAFAFVAPLQKDLWAAKVRGVDIIGARNTAIHMLDYMSTFRVKKTVACWGKLKSDRGWLLAESLKAAGI